MSSANINYISLNEAANLTNYSQEYISLLCRQKKLKGTKIGRNWVTTKEWVENYINKTKGSGENVISVKIKNAEKQLVSNISRSSTKFCDKNESKVLEHKERATCSSDEQVNLFPYTEKSILVFFRRIILVTFIVGIFVIGLVLFPSRILHSVKLMFSETEKVMAVASFNLNSFLSSFNENQTKERLEIVTGVKTFVDGEDNNETEDQKTNEGIMIIPLEGEIDSEENQKFIEKLSSSFSDDVNVSPSEDGVSGTITSQENPDDNYIYLNVEKIINSQ
ncbi:MAG: helix-turn-helix domain-containing protein [Patescibacteria group bacterium]|nr:helix-turn-helix domain-containing protein [Patescibacteria group bacterium]